MISRPLDLASKLRPEPRYFDLLFFVNVGLLVLLFYAYGSRFILAPGLGVDFKLPAMAGAMAGAAPADGAMISVRPSGQIFADGLLNMAQLQQWLKAEAKKSRRPSLLVRASVGVPVEEIAKIVSAAQEAGFVRIVLGAEEPASSAGEGH
ncbi:MAG TPA: biopolymer transporter ExbD [Opitutus sp.]|nr:biopolymer transporter ExbD [Opitutus sp.]